MDEKKKEALIELLKILCDCPELADRITITIKPNSKPSKAEPESEWLSRQRGAEATAPS